MTTNNPSTLIALEVTEASVGLLGLKLGMTRKRTQMSAYIGGIVGKNVPIITRTCQTNPSRDKMIEVLKIYQAIIGTADSIIGYLPFMKTDLKWLHMIGKPEGS
jgi:hypothetical protein